MDSTQINLLVKQGKFPIGCLNPELIETHISWVILCDHFAFKIKKPVHYSFLDFSTLQKRNYYCRQEIALNRRLVENTYLGVVPVVETDGNLAIVLKEKENVIDYAVMMTRMDTDRRMDLLLQQNEVTLDHIAQIAEILVKFHKKAEVAYGADHLSVQHNFKDLYEEIDYLSEKLGAVYGEFIDETVKKSSAFIHSHQNTLKMRSELGFIRDCHGDLHSRNIFLLDKPVIFDCIEFNPAIRQIDILSELAFFCMDLEAFGHSELSQYFMVCYSKLSSTIHTEAEHDLFIYFKAYRANVRAKVNALRAKDAEGEDHNHALAECKKYLELMRGYMDEISPTSVDL